MQSYLQYRAFGALVKAQVQHNKQGNWDYASRRPQPTENDLEKEGNASRADTLADENGPQVEPDATSLDQRASQHDSSDDQYDPEALRKINTHNTTGTQLGISLDGVHVRDRTTREGKELGKVFVVGFDGEYDKMNPRNWSFTKRALATTKLSLIALVVGLAASIDSAAIPQASAAFGVSQVAEGLATGVFLCGFGIGALIAGPLSETVGRNPVYIGSILIYMLFIMGAGLSQNLGQQLVCRFLAGFFGESPLTTVGGSLGDMWDPMQRLIAFPMFAGFGFLGPVLGPIIGGFIAESSLVSWRWTEWITLIMSGLLLVILLLFQPETYEPILLQWKASQLRKITGDHRYVAPIEIHREPFRRRIIRALYRPFVMTIQEPIIMLWTAYLTVIYIILFGFLDGYTYVFGDTYNMSQGITGLLFVGIAIGLFIASGPLTALIYRWAKKAHVEMRAANPDKPNLHLPPEYRLWYAMLGAPAVPISLFWMGWTAYPSISYWSPLIASVLFGYGILTIFISTYQYLIDSYEVYAASALTFVTLVRYCASGGIVEVSIPMYRNLGVHWTLTLLALISLVFTPVPYLFYRYGPWIRSKSKFAFAEH